MSGSFENFSNTLLYQYKDLIKATSWSLFNRRTRMDFIVAKDPNVFESNLFLLTIVG
jgi:hypothetical protein